ncbi:3'-5' exonuclease [Vibrio sp. JC009]|uniref:3'-5' exonuclease n=1 Tax=Vibrio sp. JC009 TaxID=2912314 RepID=UPI0023AFDBCE|nr:3'-5' exonuclease [Vibrio sp. JC009]WED24114.1 3'-5' exonuclease [Vibrio sp. JC009]
MLWKNIFHPLSKLERKRVEALQGRKLPLFVQENIAWQYPGLDDETKQQDFICLDLETTGLDPKTDQILSIGWVEMKGMNIDLSSSVQLMIKGCRKVRARTAVINHITPEMLQQGCSLDEAFLEFFNRAKGKIIVAHARFVEQHFIDNYLKQSFNLEPLPFLWLDTLNIEKYLCRHLDNNTSPDLRLSAIRERYGLPEYNTHSALIDSVSTAELLLAQICRIYRDDKSCFGRLYRISHSK